MEAPTGSSFDRDDEDAVDAAASEEPIRVLVRVRPAATRGTPNDVASGCVGVEPPDTLRITRPAANKGEVRAKFDAVIGGEASQRGTFAHVRPAVDAALSGVNATVFAYGQTGSGKTFTLFGGLLPGDAQPPRAPEDGGAATSDRELLEAAEGAATDLEGMARARSASSSRARPSRRGTACGSR